MRLPAAFVRTVSGAYGAAGAAWVAALPTLAAECRRAWGLEPEGALGLSYGYVERVRRSDGSRAVLKLTLPGAAEGEREAAALAWFGPQAAPRVLAHDPGRGALLLERLDPGTQLVELARRDDEAATRAAAGLMLRLWRPPPARHPFPDAVRWGMALEGPAAGSPALPAAAVARARAEHAELCGSAGAPVVLHADLHHFNVLRAGGGWRAIDPKGVVGEPAYECGALLRNPVGEAPSRARLLRRVAVLSEAVGIDAARVRAWGHCQAVLSAVWSVEDAGDPRFALRCAELLAG